VLLECFESALKFSGVLLCSKALLSSPVLAELCKSEHLDRSIPLVLLLISLLASASSLLLLYAQKVTAIEARHFIASLAAARRSVPESMVAE